MSNFAPTWNPTPISACGTMLVRFGNTVDRNPSMVLEPLTGSHCALTPVTVDTERDSCGIFMNMPAVKLPSWSRMSTPSRTSATSPSPRFRLKSGEEAVRGIAVI